MDPSEFNACFGTLEKSGDRARSTVIIFVTVYAAVAVYTLNAFIYPARQFRFDEAKAEMSDIIFCRERPLGNVPSDVQKPSPRTCKALLTGAVFSDALDARFKNAEQDYLMHNLQRAQDESARIADFQIPLISVITDRDWFWLINALSGLFIYYLVALSLESQLTMLDYLVERSSGQAVRLRMILTTLVLVGSRPFQSVGITQIWRWPWPIFVNFLLGLPIIVSLLLIRDIHLILLSQAAPKKTIYFPAGYLPTKDEGYRYIQLVLGPSCFYGWALLLSVVCCIWQGSVLWRILRRVRHFNNCFVRTMAEIDRLEACPTPADH